MSFSYRLGPMVNALVAQVRGLDIFGLPGVVGCHVAFYSYADSNQWGGKCSSPCSHLRTRCGRPRERRLIPV